MRATQNQAIPLNGFRWMDADAYLFDIDGTLLVTRDLVHRNALHRAMREVYGVDATIDGIAYHGKTDLGILRAALERMGICGAVFEAKLSAALNIVCLDVAANANRIVANVCDGIPEVLAQLKAAGKLLGVASGNLEAVGWHKVEAADLRRFFSFGCFSDHCEMRMDIFRHGMDEARRRVRENAAVCFVGDTPEDILAARGVGAQVVAVCTGIFKNDELARHAPDACISSCVELLGR
jgi:phosphoglycolate phosphatase-like HAD superfamily hydrolase